MAQHYNPRLLTQAQKPNKQALEGIKAALAELADPAVIRLLLDGQHQVGLILVAGRLDVPGEDFNHAVGSEQ